MQVHKREFFITNPLMQIAWGVPIVISISEIASAVIMHLMMIIVLMHNDVRKFAHKLDAIVTLYIIWPNQD